MVRLLTWLLRFVRLIVPHLIRLLQLLWTCMKAILAVIIQVVPLAASRMVDHWHEYLIEHNVPTEYDQAIHYSGTVLAYGTLIVGWIVLSYFTVGVIGLLLQIVF